MSEHAHSTSTVASDWVIRKELPDWTAADQADLDHWLAESMHHRVAFLRAADVWDRANRLRALNRPAYRRFSFLRDRLTFPLLLRSAAAACLAIAAGIGALNWLGRPQEAVYATAIGGHETVPLADGSQVELNTNTVLRVSESASQRVAKLERGEAYFNIRHDAKRPFFVYAAGHRIVDLGTKFEVRDEDGRLKVTLLEGSARLESSQAWAPAHSVVLKPGDVAFASVQSLRVVREREKSLTNSLGWRRGVIVFEHTTLQDAVAELNRYNHRQIIIADAGVGRMKIDATLPVNGVDAIVRVAEDVFGVHASSRPDGTIVISR